MNDYHPKITPTHTPHILWDWGTAYDLFASLHVLHHPERFGLRGSWAAGVRSRLGASQRSILEDAQGVLSSRPIIWTSRLPEPKDAATVIQGLEQIAPEERLRALVQHGGSDIQIAERLDEISARRSWNEDDLELLRMYQQQKGRSPQPSGLATTLNWWTHVEEFGELYLDALRAYVGSFFGEEEMRIRPFLQQSLARAQEMADAMDFSQLMVELSQGVKISILEEATQVMFVPSYWITPLVMYDSNIEDGWIVMFGARPADVALVPGEVLPDAMMRALKALSDPTRLHILRYLSDTPLTPSQLAKKLRLRPPTVTHHLSTLRLAGLVYVSMNAEGEKRYTVRQAAVKDTFESLQRFLSVEGDQAA